MCVTCAGNFRTLDLRLFEFSRFHLPHARHAIYAIRHLNNSTTRGIAIRTKLITYTIMDTRVILYTLVVYVQNIILRFVGSQDARACISYNIILCTMIVIRVYTCRGLFTLLLPRRRTVLIDTETLGGGGEGRVG